MAAGGSGTPRGAACDPRIAAGAASAGDAPALEHDVRELRRVQGSLPGAKLVIADCGMTEEARGLADYLAVREENAAVVNGADFRLE